MNYPHLRDFVDNVTPSDPDEVINTLLLPKYGTWGCEFFETNLARATQAAVENWVLGLTPFSPELLLGENKLMDELLELAK